MRASTRIVDFVITITDKAFQIPDDPRQFTTCTIGRNSNCEINVSQFFSKVSRKHCRIRVSKRKLYITDLGSSRGTFINNERLEAGVEHQFQTSDTVQLAGCLRLVFVTEDNEKDTTVEE